MSISTPANNRSEGKRFFFSKCGEVSQIEANGGDLGYAAAVNRDLTSRSDQARYAACFHTCFHIDMKRDEKGKGESPIYRAFPLRQFI